MLALTEGKTSAKTSPTHQDAARRRQAALGAPRAACRRRAASRFVGEVFADVFPSVSASITTAVREISTPSLRHLQENRSSFGRAKLHRAGTRPPSPPRRGSLGAALVHSPVWVTGLPLRVTHARPIRVAEAVAERIFVVFFWHAGLRPIFAAMNRRTGLTLGIVVPGRPRLRRHRICEQRAPETRAPLRSVDRGRIVARVTATGTLSALVTVQVGSQVSGRIQEIHADFNSPVKKGQVIAQASIPQLFQAARRAGARQLRRRPQGNVAKARGAGGRRRAAVRARQGARRAEADRAGRPRHRARPTPRPRRRAGRRRARRASRRRSAALQPGAGQPRVHDDRLAHRRRRDLAQRRRRADRRRVAAGADAVHDRRGPAQDAGRHQRRRGRRRQAAAGHGGDVHRRRVSRASGSTARSGRSATRRRRCRTSSPTTR